MAGSTVKMGVDVTQFKQGMKEAQNSVKTLDAALAYNQKQMKASGNAEKDFTAQANLLNAKLKEQKNIVKNAQNALKEMERNGVKTTSAAYQDMQRQLINAQSAILDTEAAINSLGTAEQTAAHGADQLSESVASIGKKMSLQQVMDGLKSISGVIESAAKAAWDLGEALVSSVKDAAAMADDAATMAEIYNIPLTKMLQMQGLVESGLDTSVEAILGAMSKMSKGVGTNSKATLDTLKELGLAYDTFGGKTGEGFTQLVTKDPDEMFWKAGQAILALGDAFEQEAYAQALFGKGWKELRPLFNTYGSQQEYEKALEGVEVNSEDTIQNLADLNDKLAELEHNFTVVKTELLGALAPALTTISTIINDVLVEFNKYLQSEEGQAKLQELSDAVVSLFDGLKDIKPGDVIDTAKDILDGIVDAFRWISENWQSVENGIKAIAAAWGLIKVTKGTTALINLVNGAKGLGTGGATAAGSGVGVGTGTATGSGLAGASAAAAGGSTIGAEVSAAMAGGGLSGVAVAIAPAIAIAVTTALEVDRQNKKLDEQDMHLAVADALDEIAGDNRTADFIRRAALATGPERDENGNTIGQGFFISMNPGDIDGMLNELKGLDESQMAALMEALRNYSPITAGNYSDTMLQNFLNGEGGYETWQLQALLENITSALEQAAGEGGLPLDVQPVIEDPAEANAAIRDAIGTVVVPVEGDPTMMGYPHANGLFSVPWDGYPAILHKGERVVPAAQANNYNSNIYFGNVNLNNGLEIEALTESIDRRNRRQRSGYGAN